MSDRPAAAPPGTVRTLLTGAAMGTADLVPGFSGGTVALVGGIYPRLVANIRAAAHVVALFARLRWRPLPAALAALEWTFLITLLSGIVGAAVLLASTLRGLLVAEPVVMSAVFLGLVFGAALVARHQLHAPLTVRGGVIVVLSGVITALVLGARPAVSDEPSLVLIAGTAAIAICAMILPGVSGSFLLLMLGTYEPVLAAVADRDLIIIAVAIGGAVVGLLSFSTLLHWLLRRAHDGVLAILIGLMLGSARVLWPWPSTAGVGDPTIAAPAGQVLASLLAAGVAFLAVIVVSRRLRRARLQNAPH